MIRKAWSLLWLIVIGFIVVAVVMAAIKPFIALIGIVAAIIMLAAIITVIARVIWKFWKHF